MRAAEREAERRFPLWLPTGDYEIDREDYSELDAKWQNEDTERDRAHFVQGAEWQAERDAERIAELEAEVRAHRAREEAGTWDDDNGHNLLRRFVGPWEVDPDREYTAEEMRHIAEVLPVDGGEGGDET